MNSKGPLRSLLVAAAVFVVWAAITLAAPPNELTGWFKEVTAIAGVDQPHKNRSFHNPYAHIMEGYTALGAAAAAADYNNDGWVDLFVTDSSETGRNKLYRNNGDFTFTDVADRAGLAEGNDARNASADALWFDYDNDGWKDLLLVRFGQNLLFRNQGDGTFKNVTTGSGLERYLNCIVAVAFDYDRDGKLDLILGSYFRPVNLFDPDTTDFFPESFEEADNGGGVTLFRNLGGGRFQDVTVKTGLEQSGWVLDIGHADADLDGDDDLYIAVDFGRDRFFVNDGKGAFVEKPIDPSQKKETKKGMNADWGDFDNDGDFDIFVTNITDEYMKEGNYLWLNNGDGSFTDVAKATEVDSTGWGWAGKFFDYDNDGRLDLYVVNGWVSAGPENYVVDIFNIIIDPKVRLADVRNWPAMGNKSLSGYQRNALFHNEGGVFRDQAKRHGVDFIEDGRGVAVADFDNDGRLDFLVTNANKGPHLVRNLSPNGSHWLAAKLIGTQSNRDAVGARVSVWAGGERQVTFVNGGNGFASQSSSRVHFGLGAATSAEQLEIEWPSGLKESYSSLPANRLYVITEGERKAVSTAESTAVRRK